jgi:hypothetical protein
MPRRNKYWPGAWLATCAICGRTRYNHELARGVDGPEQGRPVCRDTCLSPRNPRSDNVRVERPESRPEWPRTIDPGDGYEELPQLEED